MKIPDITEIDKRIIKLVMPVQEAKISNGHERYQIPGFPFYERIAFFHLEYNKITFQNAMGN
jgi:hypothetical protein